MVANKSFAIDATFLLRDAEAAFFGSTPLVDERGRNTSVLYGTVRGLFQLRRTLGIDRGLVVVGSDAYDVSSAINVEIFVEFLQCIGTNVLHERETPVGALCRSMLSNNDVAWIVTRNRSLMQLINAQCGVILMSQGAVPEVATEKDLASNYHIQAKQVPSLLALTDTGSNESLTIKQAIRLLEVCKTLDCAFDSLSVDQISPKTRRFLSANKALLLSHLQELTIADLSGARPVAPIADIARNDPESHRMCQAYGFPSLGRLLESPPRIELVGSARDSRHAYVAIVDEASLDEMTKLVSSAETCAVDTESTDKDPRKASLLGVALAVSEGRSFYLPLVDTDLRNITVASVTDVLRRLLGGNIKFIGHNLKYDYVLLRRYGLQINDTHFDTMLAAHECFGDWDFFNLGAVAKKLIGKDIKRYRDIVEDGESCRDVPFGDLVEHGCSDADTTLRLYGRLTAILKEKGIFDQFASDVMPLMRLLGDKEFGGVRVDIGLIASTMDALLIEVDSARASIIAKVGRNFDLDSMKDIASILSAEEGLRDQIGRRPLRQNQLEQLAQESELARFIVHYRRLKTQVKHLDAICMAENNGKVFPLFSQMKAGYGRISSATPSLFEPDGSLRTEAVLDADVRRLIPSKTRALNILQELAGDQALKRDRQTGNGEFIAGEQPSLAGLSHTDVLISLATGVSNATLSKRFLITARRASDLRELVTCRYPQLFTWLDEYRRSIEASGFASSGECRKYLDGLGSSDIHKRNSAKQSAIRWLIGV